MCTAKCLQNFWQHFSPCQKPTQARAYTRTHTLALSLYALLKSGTAGHSPCLHTVWLNVLMCACHMQVKHADTVLNSSILYCLLIVAMFTSTYWYLLQRTEATLYERTDCVYHANSRECSRVCVFHSFSSGVDPVRCFCQGLVHSEDDSCTYVHIYKLISGE